MIFLPKSSNSLLLLDKISTIGINTPMPRISKNTVTTEEINIIKIFFGGTPKSIRTLKKFFIIVAKLKV